VRGPRGYDAAKKVKGRKRHIAVDTSGLLLGVLVHAADIQDADSAGDLLKRIKPLYCWLEAVFADSIYNRVAVLVACFLLGMTLIIVRRIADSTGFVIVPRRWVVNARTMLPTHVSSGRQGSTAMNSVHRGGMVLAALG
jgi:putative transposase